MAFSGIKHLSSLEVAQRWGEISRALDHYNGLMSGECTLDDLWSGVLKGTVQVLYSENPKVFAVTEIIQGPRSGLLRVLAVGGVLKGFDMRLFENWARMVGVKEIEGSCYGEQWIRLFERYGYRPRYVTLRKEL